MIKSILHKIVNFIKRFFTGKHKKRNIWLAVILVIVIILGSLIFSGKNNKDSIQTGFVKRENLKETVLSTGQIVSSIDLGLSFQVNGVVKKINVKEGDKVKKGQLLASLDAASALATLTSAKGSLMQAQANYDKLVAGSNFDNLNSDVTVVASKKIALDGANNDAINSLTDAKIKSYSALATVSDLRNTYFTGFDGDARAAISQIESAVLTINSAINSVKDDYSQADLDSAVSSVVSALKIISSSLKTVRETLNTEYYYGRVPSTEKEEVDSQRTSINSILSSVISYQLAVSNAKIAMLQGKPEIDLAKGQILYAKGQVDAAQAVVNNSLITAPADGTITSIDIKVGEQSTPLKVVMTLQDIGNLYVEADISEANIASLQLGQSIDYTFDALGPDQHFYGAVLSINPASTVVSGVVNYLVKGSLENIPNIKPGMTVNMTILVAQKDNVLSVPLTAVINKNSKKYVRVIKDSKKKTYYETEVQTGLRADGGLIEIVSGLNEGQEVVVYIKK